VKNWMGFLAAAFTFMELYTFGHTFAVSDTDPKQYYEKYNLSGIREQLTEGKFKVQGRIYRGNGQGELLFPRNLGNVARIPFVDGYNQLRLSRWNDLMWKIDVRKGQRLFNIQYIKKPGEFRLEPVDAVPRFFLTTSVSTVASREAAIEIINDDAFIPGRDMVLEKAPGIRIDKGTPCSGTIRLVKETINRIELEVTAPTNCMLSVSELYYPAWKAKIDRKKVGIIPANCALRGIPVPSGSHRIVMYYQSDAMHTGGIISLAAVFFALLILFGDRNRHLRTVSYRITGFFRTSENQDATKAT